MNYEQAQEQKVAEELAKKLVDFQCNVHLVDEPSEITPYSIELWANMSFDYADEFLSEGEEPAFTLAELWAVIKLRVKISEILNKDII